MTRIIRIILPACVVLTVAACGQSLNNGSNGGAATGGGKQSLIVGSANFPENELLADIYAGALKAKGLSVSTKLNIGSREILIPALERGQITVLPEYTGSLLSFVTKDKSEPTATAKQVAQLKADLPGGLTVLPPAAAQDQNTVTCSRPVAQKYGLHTLDDLAKVSRNLTLGGPPELARRTDFGSVKGLKRVYGVVFKSFRPLDEAGPLTVSALKSGKVDCANLFSTQSAIAVNGFVTLADPKRFSESEAIIPLIAKGAATPKARAALGAVSAKLTTDNLKQMVKRVEVDKDDATTVADDFLKQQGLG
jgi:osmoprotectant transport system substrate-binding protein